MQVLVTNDIMLISICLVLLFKCAANLEECQYKQEDIDESSINEIVEIHNMYRQMAINGTIDNQPQAEPESMNLLKWDQTLAEEALKVAKTCKFEHIRLYKSESGEPLGQNLHRSCSNKPRKPSWKKATEDWYDENKLYNFPDKPNHSNGHYTQLIWGKSKYVGCNYVSYIRKDVGIKTPHCMLFVCHYVPAGNIEGEVPYGTVLPEPKEKSSLFPFGLN